MKKITFFKTLMVIAISVFSLNSLFAQGGMIREISLERQVENSVAVVEGEVINKKYVWNATRDNILTIHTVKVFKVFKGDNDTTIEVITPGGILDGIEQVTVPNLHLKLNDVGVFTLNDSRYVSGASNNTGVRKYDVYSSLQGFYKYNLRNNAVTHVFRGNSNGFQALYDEITELTKTEYTSISKTNFSQFNAANAKNSAALLDPSGISFVPTIATAGTNTQITISGSGFGAVEGTVGFRDADTGGVEPNDPNMAKYVNALTEEIISWSDTQIVVEVPSGAGTGDIKVTNNDSTEGVSAGELTITYALINASGGIETQHYSQDNSGSITWIMNSDFNSNASAKSSFLRAFEEWRCSTDINWLLDSGTTSINQSLIDQTSVITFDTAANPLPDGVLGTCTYVIGSCNAERDLIGELDIVFDDDINDPSTAAMESWYFGEDPNGIGFTQWDFQSVALHELGHGHQLGHVINTNDVMHYAISNFEIQRTLSSDNISGAIVVQQLGTNDPLCGATAMTDYTGTCSLGTNDEILENSISMYPNPAKDQVYIKSTGINLDKVEVFDVSGRLITQVEGQDSTGTVKVNFAGAAKGVYFVNMHSDNNSITKKLIIN